MRILVASDVFPPGCDGSGWSAFHLARALAEAGHEVRVVKPEPGLIGIRRRAYEGLEVTDFGYPYADVPFLRNVLKSDLLGVRLEGFLCRALEEWPAEVVHAQHWLSAGPSVRAALRLGRAAIVTVRDHWPICYFTTWTVEGERCPSCSLRHRLACMKAKEPRWYWAGLFLGSYMRREVRRRQEALRQASAVVAVSRYIAEEVVRPIGVGRLEVVPNFVEVGEIERVATEPPEVELPERFWLFVGKLDVLKGAQLLLDAAQLLRGEAPLVVVGDGPERSAMQQRAAREGLDVRFLPWVENREVWRILGRAAVVVVPSVLAEALSRTILEAMAAGAPVVATARGGTADQIVDGKTGWLVPPEPRALAEAVGRCLRNPGEARAMAARALELVRSRFDRSAVLPRMEALYREVLAADRGAAHCT